MDGKDKINGASSDSGYYQGFWNGLTKLAGHYKQYLVKPAEAEESVTRSNDFVTGSPSERSQRQVGLAHSPDDTPESLYSDEFTTLMTDALWNICEDSQPQAMPPIVSETSDPTESLGVKLPSFSLKSEQEMQELDFEVVEMTAVDQELAQTLDHYVNVLSGFDPVYWNGLTEEAQRAIIENVLKLTSFLDSISPNILAQSLHRLMDHSDAQGFQVDLKASITKLESLSQRLASLFDRKSQVLGLLAQLRFQLKAEFYRSQMEGLSGVHQASQLNWEITNNIASMDPSVLNADGTAQQFDTDILRNSNFAVFDQQGLNFHSAVCLYEHTEDQSTSKEESNDRFKEECRAQLLSLCRDKSASLKGVLTDMVSQSPYNPLGNTLRVMVQEKLGAFHVFAPQERKCETQIHVNDDGRLQLRFVLAFPSYKLTTEDGHCFHIKQPVSITSSMDLNPPEYTRDRRLGDISIALGKAEESKLYNG